MKIYTWKLTIDSDDKVCRIHKERKNHGNLHRRIEDIKHLRMGINEVGRNNDGGEDGRSERRGGWKGLKSFKPD